jgi:hypothetical protein
MKRAIAIAILACACGAQAPDAHTEAGPGEVAAPDGASIGEVLDAIRTELARRGHAGECFLAWDTELEENLTVHIGDRSREAGVSCGGLDDLASTLEGRCIFVRFYFFERPSLRTHAVSFYFAPPGRAYAARGMGGASIELPAREVIFQDAAMDTRLVLGIPLSLPPAEEEAGRAPPDIPASTFVAPSENPMDDPEVAAALAQLVELAQSCRDESDQGSLVLEWNVAPDGEIDQVRALTASVTEGARSCAIELVDEASFPEHGGEHPIDFCVPVMLDRRLRSEEPEE